MITFLHFVRKMRFVNIYFYKKHFYIITAVLIVCIVIYMYSALITLSSVFNNQINQQLSDTNRLQFPSLVHYLSYISDEQSALTPAYKLSRRQYNNKANIVIGIPHIRRSKQFYLMTTLQSLISNLTQIDLKEILIVIFIGETNIDYVMNITNGIENKFKEFIDMGVIEVISPSQHYYPDFEKTFTKQTLGDPIKRVHWRTKENLDFAYLMMYSYTKGNYFLLLEDDVESKPGSITAIRNHILELNNTEWFLLRYCRLGTAALLFKCSSLPQLISFMLIFKDKQPVDWLIDYIMRVNNCAIDMSHQNCVKQINKIMLTFFNPLLFNHIGYYSSLDGKIQKSD